MSTSALQVARTGLDAQSARMRIIANNLANVNTTAFQRDRAEFATLPIRRSPPRARARPATINMRRASISAPASG